MSQEMELRVIGQSEFSKSKKKVQQHRTTTAIDQHLASSSTPNESVDFEVLLLETKAGTSRTAPGKLAVFCKYVLPWLSIDDLCSLLRTCSRMMELVGEYIHETYSLMPILSYEDSIYSSAGSMNGLFKYIQNVRITHHSKLKTIVNECESLEKVTLSQVNLNNLSPTLIYCVQKMLKNVQVLGLVDCDIKHDFHANVLKWCPQLKHLHIHDCQFGRESLSHEYKSLKCIRLIVRRQISGLKSFLERNPNISTLEVSSYFILENLKSLSRTDASLEELTVFEADTEICNIAPDLIELFELGLYKRLNLFAHHLDTPLVHLLEEFKGLRKIICYRIMDDIQMPMLPNLTVLKVEKLHRILSIESLLNLEVFCACEASADQITVLIDNARKINTISILNVNSGEYLDKDVLNVAALNQRREEVPSAKKVTIYTGERVFLATKWAINQLNFSKVELRQCIQNDEWWDTCNLS